PAPAHAPPAPAPAPVVEPPVANAAEFEMNDSGWFAESPSTSENYVFEPIMEYPDVTADDVHLPEADSALDQGAYPDITVDDSFAIAEASPPDVGGPDEFGNIPPDWYPDPDDTTRYRWWDGQNWTDYVG
ncbi:MAG TPA: DUF2510 domain-containing protein, partial [Microthrixaceae bacterium]|nr:DUF2510 domain-containing protein [Microthrixaceae bacterium]